MPEHVHDFNVAAEVWVKYFFFRIRTADLHFFPDIF